ncbi:hypothetical protein [Ekhidna sp.]|uniref:hypothetical protein n=1 Tax=Ekhidna sp. TaxID=2608089 RepID=UPI003CCB7DCE
MESIVIQADSKETKALFEKLASKMGLNFRNLDAKFLEEIEEVAMGVAIKEGETTDFVSEEEVRKALG